MTTYAVTGVTGKFGSVAVKVLAGLVPASNIIALARNVEKAQASVPAGVTVRQGDYTDVEGLKQALTGVDKLLFISSVPGGEVSRQTQHQNVIDAANAAGVSYIAYTSYSHADTAKSPLSEDHKYTEKALKESGLAYSFLRNNWYLENDAGVIQGAFKGQPFTYAAGEGKVGWAPEAAYAEAAARVLATADPKAIYEFGGPAITYAQLAEQVKAVSDQSFDVASVSEADYQKGLETAGLDATTAAIITSMQTLIHNGDLAQSDDTLATVLGRPVTPIQTALKALKAN
ncbi:NAD(P)H-binding protein [Secundilactobacillus muriivasis]